MNDKLLRWAIYSHSAIRHYRKRKILNKLTWLVYIFSSTKVRSGIDRQNGFGEYLHHIYTFKRITEMQKELERYQSQSTKEEN